MLIITRKLHEKQAGLVNLTTNKALYCCSCNLKMKLSCPNKMKDAEITLENSKKWDKSIQLIKDEKKKQVVLPGERTLEFMQEKQIATNAS